MSRATILVLLGHYVPGFRMGGPVRSISNLVAHLQKDFDFRVLTSDRDLGDTVPYAGVESDRWLTVGPTLVHYTSPAKLSLGKLARLIAATPHDLLYINSFFSGRFTIAPLVARRLGMLPRRPTVIAPRGEFSPGALALKPLKKRAWLVLARSAGLYSDLVWQASAASDVQSIQALMGVASSNIGIAANLPAPLPSMPPAHRPRPLGAPLSVVFLSRISPMKNLDFALRILADVVVPIDFAIYGPTENVAYLAACRTLADSLPPHIRVEWHGPVDPADVPTTLARYDLFFLPTRGENFGHVIAESLGAGTPVLVSDATPWRGLAQAGVGHDLPLANESSFIAAIEAAASETPVTALARRQRAFDYAKRRQDNGADINANRELFRAVLGARPPFPLVS